MTLNSQATFPNTRTYVLKLHRDAQPSQLCGRIESLASGQQCTFADGAELLACLARTLPLVDADQDSEVPHPPPDADSAAA
jgi:hypothetical protein